MSWTNSYWGELEIRSFVETMHVTMILYRPGQPSLEYKADPEDRIIEIVYLWEMYFDLLVPKVDCFQHEIPSHCSVSTSNQSSSQEDIEKIATSAQTILEATFTPCDNDETLTDILLIISTLDQCLAVSSKYCTHLFIQYLRFMWKTDERKTRSCWSSWWWFLVRFLKKEENCSKGKYSILTENTSR